MKKFFTDRARLHGLLTLVWLLLIPPAILFWRQSVPFLVMCSVYANLAGHWSAWEAAKAAAEAKEDS